MLYCKYYQAQVSKKDVWFLVSILKSMDNLEFNRTIDIENSIFEFFVPEDNKQLFLKVMNFLIKKNVVFDLKELPNRLKDFTTII